MKKIIRLILEKKRNFQKTKRIKRYIQKGHIPWSIGYNDYKWKEITKAISDYSIIKLFRSSNSITNFGKGIDERIVEIPWVLSKLSQEPTILLDAGSSLNHEVILNQESILLKKTTIYTYFPEPINFNQKQISYFYGDLRELPFKDSYYDEIVSVSTLEHIDMDNSMYGYNIPNKGNTVKKSYEYLKVINELNRVLNIKGKLLITVPYGKFENHGFFQQFDEEMIERIERILNQFGTISKNYFKYTIQGWQTSIANDCKNEISYNPHTGVGKGNDGAAHSRAICCIEFVKKKI